MGWDAHELSLEACIAQGKSVLQANVDLAEEKSFLCANTFWPAVLASENTADVPSSLLDSLSVIPEGSS